MDLQKELGLFKNINSIIYVNKIEINISRNLVQDYNLSTKPISPIKRNNHNVKLAKEKYLDRYKNVLNSATTTNIIPPHWAYVTDAGIIEYEKSIRGKPEYDDQKIESELRPISTNVAAKVQSKKVAFMVYGFGNAVREQYVIDSFCEFKFGKNRFYNPVKVIFIDISPYYCSQFYWARRLYHSKLNYRETVHLIDFIEDSEQIIQLRNSLKNKQVIHLFMGNIAGNYTESELREICENYTHPGDFLLMEYGLYDFSCAEPGNYQHKFALEALEEIYEKERVSNISLKDSINKEDMSRHINIRFHLKDIGDREINSFLRRNFIPSTFSSGKFQHEEDTVCGKTPCLLNLSG
jgi:hypothetical protein